MLAFSLPHCQPAPDLLPLLRQAFAQKSLAAPGRRGASGVLGGPAGGLGRSGASLATGGWPGLAIHRLSGLKPVTWIRHGRRAVVNCGNGWRWPDLA
ncbi:hypothetical protein DFAR_740006 [Desulfarculales bacterium]